MTPPRVMTADDLLRADDGRASHELSAGENANLCADCQKCCTYITVEIDSPRSAQDYDQWIWALYHDHISIFVEKPEKWFLQVDTLCGKLDSKGRCSIYGGHPVLCRQYDPRYCERRHRVPGILHVFKTGEELEAWIRARRPGHYRNLVRFRDAHPVGGAAPGPALVQIEPATTNGRGRGTAAMGARGAARRALR